LAISFTPNYSKTHKKENTKIKNSRLRRAIGFKTKKTKHRQQRVIKVEEP
jgi:hypothetical protein